MTSFLYRMLAWSLWLLGVGLLPLLKLGKFRHQRWLSARLLPPALIQQPGLWLHAVSVGEIKIALELYRAIPKSACQDVLFTTTTPSGLAFLEENLPEGATGRLLPWDIRWAYQRFFGPWRVPKLLLVETEIWPRLFAFVAQQGAAVGIVNARLSHKTLRLKKLSVLRRAMARLDWVAARSDLDAERFVACGLDARRVHVTGNIKFDFEAPVLQSGKLQAWLSHENRTVIFASMASEEAELLADEVQKLLDWHPQVQVLWAPRHLDEIEKHQLALEPMKPQLRSAIQGQPRLLLLDTIGELSGCYAFAELSFVGGSFNKRGGQNFMESLQVGTPALVGPSTENFRVEVADALAAGAILVVEKPREVSPNLIALLEQPARSLAMAKAGKSFLEKHVGAVARTVQVLLDSRAVAKP